MKLPESGLKLCSLVRKSGELELSIVRVAVPEPAPDEVIIRVEATPINPSDLGLMFGAADLSTVRLSGTRDEPIVTATISERAMNSMAGRVDVSMAVGNEGAGVVVNSGSSPEAQALLGKAVATFSGGMYAQYRCVKAAKCVALPPGALPVDGASIFVNPLTALSMVDTMRREGHSALVHTAAASNLGQMLTRVCLQDNIELVNIVRSEAQVNLLRSIGSRHICNSSVPTFIADLTRDLIATGATLAFDAVGGGLLADQILNCMEAAQANTGKGYSRYGSTIHKQVYIYGALDTGATVLHRKCGYAFAVGGWLLPPHLDRIGTEAARTMQTRVLSELKTTFASHYTREVGLTEALRLEEIQAYARRATGEKYLINPQKGQ